MPPNFEIRPVTPDEVEAYARAPLAAFGETFDPERFKLEWTHHELDRTLAAFDDGEIVGTGRLYSLELTLPGGALAPVAAVSWISVLPTHRRHGILTAIMGRELDDAVARGESMAVLHASEGVIYRRFGYGIAASSMSFTLARRHAAFLGPPPDDGRVRLVDEAAARKAFPDIFDRARRLQPGAVSRVDQWWGNELFYVDKKDEGARFYVVYESAERVLDGYVAYKVVPRWSDDGVSRNRLEVLDLVTATPEARAVLWRYLCDVDLVETIAAGSCPVDESLRWLLAESRRLTVSRLSDGLWVRIVDAPAALAARRYAASGRIVFDVRDEFRPDGDAAGRFALDCGPDGTTCERTTADPDLALDVADLGAAYLGGVTFSTLARAGLVAERTPGALGRADAMFRSDPAPFVMTEF
jgi:predicted acetyltransferase